MLTAEETDRAAMFAAENPFPLFDEWLKEASLNEPNDPTAMSLATVDADGLPDARVVLLKGVDAQGFVFYTNTRSAKGLQLAATPRAALCFHWKSLRRQVRVRGEVAPVSDEEADAYFASRPRGSQIGAWASEQSTPLDGREVLEEACARLDRQYEDKKVPRPPHWTGYRVSPRQIEFWADRPSRLHDRLRFTRGGPAEPWERTRLFP